MSTLTLLMTTILAVAPQAKPATQEPTPADADEAALQSSEGGVSVYEFADDRLTGDQLSPDGDLIPWRAKTHHGSLINLRAHFLPELVRLSLDL